MKFQCGVRRQSVAATALWSNFLAAKYGKSKAASALRSAAALQVQCGNCPMRNLIVTKTSAVIIAFVLVLVCATSIYAIGQTRYVEFRPSPGAIRLFSNGVATAIVVDSQDYPGVLRPLSRRGDSWTSTVGFRVTPKERREGRCFSIKTTRQSRLTRFCEKC